MFEIRCKDEKAQADTSPREACSGCAGPGWSRAGQDQGGGGRRRCEGRARLGAEVRGQRCGWGRLASGRVTEHGTWLLGELKSTSEVQSSAELDVNCKYLINTDF